MKKVGCLLLCCATLPVFAQKGPCTEESIKAAIANPPLTDDFYLFNPVMTKPAVGKQERDKANAEVRADSRLMANRKNFKGEPPKIDRIVIDSTGEMAYLYGTAEVSWDEQDGKHVEGTHAFLRVWKADGGFCKMAAAMIRNEDDSAGRKYAK